METIPSPYPELFKPITIGKIVKSGCFSSTVIAQGLTLNTRIVMSAMGRLRSNQEGLATDLIAEYYAQRASAGFIVTESSPVSKRSNQHPNSPSIYNDAQAESWKKVTSAVHAKKGIIFLQLQHNGRQTHSSLQNGLEPWAPSAIKIRGVNKMAGGKEYETPHEMTIEEIKFTLNEYKEAAERAKRAGFDGVEVNGGHGFLVDQFLRDSANKRTDQYGGSPQNRCKFVIELLQILTSIFPGRVAIKLTPTSHVGDMYDSKVHETYQFLFRQLSQLQLAYVVLKKDTDDENFEGFGYPASSKQLIPDVFRSLRQYYSGVLVGNGGITLESADQDIRAGIYDIAMFAKSYINNPDLVERARHGYPLDYNIDWSTLFGGGAKGYTDYPRYEPKNSPYIELLKPIKVGDLELANRIQMSAMGRVRCTDPDLSPNDIMVTYYEQRASAGLIVTESTNISWAGYTYPGSCGIFTDNHVKGWAKVTAGVHDKGGKIFIQLYHGGRMASKKFKDLQPVAPSAIAIRGHNRFSDAPYEIPKELNAQEVQQTINDFVASAQKAKQAGFDGVELAAGHGCLIDQFLRNSANKRTDQYGGSVENRSRFLLDIVRGIAKIFPNRIGVKVTPAGPTGDLLDSDPVKLYSYLFQELSKLPVAYVTLKHDDEAEGAEGYGFPAAKRQIPDVFAALRPHYKGVLIANHVSQDEAVKGIQNKQYDAVSFARLFINNPDLVHRLRNNLELNLEYDYATFFGGGEKGYTDFKPYHEWKK